MNDIRSTTRNANLQDAIGTTIFANARVILADRVMGAGRVTVRHLHGLQEVCVKQWQHSQLEDLVHHH